MKTITALALSLFLFGCNSQPANNTATATIDETVTEKVLKHHWDAFQGNDLEETMADYTEESVLITPDRTYSGLAEIRENFVNAFAAFPRDSATLTLDKSVVKKDVGYILWNAKTPTFNLTFATDTFVIVDGKIIRQTYAGVASPL
jgi:hypothetical protein